MIVMHLQYQNNIIFSRTFYLFINIFIKKQRAQILDTKWIYSSIFKTMGSIAKFIENHENSRLGTPPTDVVERPVVRYQLVRVEGKTAMQQLQFVCSFTAKEIDYYYQVTWYIEDTPLVIKDAVRKDSIRNTNLGYDDKDTTKGYHMLGINVSYNTA